MTDASNSSDGPGALPPPAPDDPDVTGDAMSLREAFRGIPPGRAGLAALELIGIITVIALVALNPTQSGELLARVSGAVLAPLLAVRTFMAARPPRNPLLALAYAIGAAVMLGFAIEPLRLEVSLARIGGVALLIGAIGLARRATADAARPRRIVADGHATIAALLGVVLLVVPSIAVDIAVWVIAFLGAAELVVRASANLGLTRVADGPGSAFGRWLDAHGRSEAERGELYDELYYEGEQAPTKFMRFCLLMAFASTISAMGVLVDSSAVVIGAMLIAPLITPMMGMGLSLAMGWPNRLRRSALAMLAGIVIAVGIGWVLAAATRLAGNLGSNTQILSRSNPTLPDLIIAIAAGAAGSYALSRKDVSSSLPGVAVAIALVPPLSVVGVTLHAERWEQVRGTTLLFLTNLVAIVLVGAIVFVLTGIAPRKRLAESQMRVRTAGAALVVLAVLVMGALLLNGRQIASDALASDNARAAIVDWLGDDTTFSIVELDVSDDTVAVTLAGTGSPPSANLLARNLQRDLGRDVTLDLQWIPRERRVVPAD